MAIWPSKLNQFNPAPVMQNPVVRFRETDQLLQQHYNRSAEQVKGVLRLTSYSVNRRVAQ